MNRALITGVSLTLFLSACTSPGTQGGSGGDNGSGGNGSGGSSGSGSGGSSNSGGSSGSGSGGASGKGGSGSGGSVSSGGNTGSGGSSSSGGNSGSGSGGSTGSGGDGSGGATGTAGKGGATGSGGSSGSSGSGGSSGATGSGGSSGSSGSGGATGAAGAGGSTSAQPSLVTSASGAYWQTSGTLSTVTSGTATVTVNSTTMQTWEGFGGAFNEMGWSYLKTLSSGDQAKALDLLFGADAAHFGIGRIPIGASDYALQRYSEDETSGDTSLTHFSISEDMNYLIPFIQAAQKVNSSLRFWASPWTPPTWMKTTSGSVQGTNCSLVGSTMFDGGCMNATTSNMTTYANYLMKFVTDYSAQGITIDTISPQNEPSYAQGYPSCLWNPTDYVTFVKTYLGPTFASSSTKIMLGTMSNGDNSQQSHDLIILNDVTADSTAKGFEKVAGLQWGMLDIYEQNASWITGASGIPFWATEHKCGNYPWNPSGEPAYVEPAPNNLAYGVESWGYIRNAIKAGVTAYNAWNMVLDQEGKGNDTTRSWSQDTLLIAKGSTGTYTCNGTAISSSLCATPAYYVFRHFAQFVQVGAKVLTTTGGDAIAFKNPDGSYVVTMYNSGGAGTQIVSVNGKLLSFMMPAAGWATVYSTP